MNHRDFLRQLSPNEKRSLTEKTDTSALLRLSTLVLLFAVFSIGILSQSSIWPLLLLPQGLLIVSLFHLQHECIHDTPFRSRRLNPMVGSICGFILLLPAEWFRYFHREHHRYTQIEGKDPELETSKPSTKRQWLIHVSGIPVFLSLLKVISKCSTGSVNDSFIPDSARSSVIKQARMMCFGYVLLFITSLVFQSTALFWVWIVPLVIGQPFLRLYLLAEHTLCENTDDMFLNTRTVLCSSIVRWFTWNMPYHTEHHIFPAVPFHQLPSLHRQLATYLQHTNRSYGEFNTQLYKTLK